MKRLLVLVAVLVVAGAAGFVSLRHDAPIVRGNALGGWGGKLVTSRDLGNVDARTFYPRYRPGRFRVLVGVTNRRRWPVSVRGIASAVEPGGVPPFELLGAQVTARNAFTLAHLRPLDARHPLRLAAHEERGVVLTYRIAARCPAGQPEDYLRHLDTLVRVSEDVPALRLRLRVGPVASTERFTLPFALTLACAHRIVPA